MIYIEQSEFKRDLSVQKYLERIGYTGSLECSLENLSALQQAHVMDVPYENLDIMAGLPVSLSMPLWSSMADGSNM